MRYQLLDNDSGFRHKNPDDYGASGFFVLKPSMVFVTFLISRMLSPVSLIVRSVVSISRAEELKKSTMEAQPLKNNKLKIEVSAINNVLFIICVLLILSFKIASLNIKSNKKAAPSQNGF